MAVCQPCTKASFCLDCFLSGTWTCNLRVGSASKLTKNTWVAGGMRPGSDLAEAGLADVSAAAPGHSTAAAEEQTGQGEGLRQAGAWEHCISGLKKV